MSYMCSECEDDIHRASYKCLDCNKLYCEPMARIHDQVLNHSNHQVMSIETLAEPQSLESIPMFCQEHSKVLDLYCITCEDAQEVSCFLCSYCILFPPHREHCFTTLKTASHGLMQRLSNQILEHQELSQQRQSQMESIRHRQIIINQLSNQIQNKLNQDCAALIHQIEVAKAHIQTLLTKAISEKQMQLAAIVTNLEFIQATQSQLVSEKEAVLKLCMDQCYPNISQYQAVIHNVRYALSLSAHLAEDTESMSTVEYHENSKKRKREHLEKENQDMFSSSVDLVDHSSKRRSFFTDWESDTSLTMRYACNVPLICSSLKADLSKHMLFLVDGKDPVNITYRVTGAGLKEFILPTCCSAQNRTPNCVKEPLFSVSCAEISLHITMSSSRLINAATHIVTDLLFSTVQDNRLIFIPVEHQCTTMSPSTIHDKHEHVHVCEQQLIIHYRPKHMSELPTGAYRLELFVNGDKVTTASNRLGLFPVSVRYAASSIFTLQDALDDDGQDRITAIAALPSLTVEEHHSNRSTSVFATAASDCTIKLWHVTHPTKRTPAVVPLVTLTHVLVNHAHPVCCLSFSRLSCYDMMDDGHDTDAADETLSVEDVTYLRHAVLVSGDEAGHVFIWNIRTGTLLRKFVSHYETPRSHITIVNIALYHRDINAFAVLSTSQGHHRIDIHPVPVKCNDDMVPNDGRRPLCNAHHLVVTGVVQSMIAVPRRNATVLLAIASETRDDLRRISFELWRVVRRRKHKTVGYIEYPDATTQAMLATELYVIPETDTALSLVAADGILRIWDLSTKSLLKSIHTRRDTVFPLQDTVLHPTICAVTKTQVIITDGSRIRSISIRLSTETTSAVDDSNDSFNNNDTSNKFCRIENGIHNECQRKPFHQVQKMKKEEEEEVLPQTWAAIDNHRVLFSTQRKNLDATENQYTETTADDCEETSVSIINSVVRDKDETDHDSGGINCTYTGRDHERAVLLCPGLLVSVVRAYRDNNDPGISVVQGWTCP